MFRLVSRTTVSPRLRRRSTSAVPTKPVPPVITNFMALSSSKIHIHVANAHILHHNTFRKRTGRPGSSHEGGFRRDIDLDSVLLLLADHPDGRLSAPTEILFPRLD